MALTASALQALTQGSDADAWRVIVEQAVEIQTSYAKRAYDDYMQQMSKIGGLYASMAKEAYKPVEKILQNGG